MCVSFMHKEVRRRETRIKRAFFHISSFHFLSFYSPACLVSRIRITMKSDPVKVQALDVFLADYVKPDYTYFM